MHVEPPGHAPSSLKEFGTHYLMIVLGILTALGLEAGVEAWHHHRLAAKTSEQVEVELRANLAEVRSTLAHNRETLKSVMTLYAELKGLAQQGPVAPQAMRKMLGERLRISVFIPGLRRDAWDAAVAGQALGHLKHDTLRRLSEAYTAQRESQQAIQSSFSAGGVLTRLTDVTVDAEFGRADPLDVLKALQSYRSTLAAVVGVELDLGNQLAETLGEPPLKAAAASAASAP